MTQTDSPSPKPLVLVVEDDHDTQAFMIAVLGPRYRVLVAASAEDAREILSTDRVSIVLLDLSLRGEEDGLSVARWIRESPAHREIPIVATTAHAFPEDRRNVLAAGCDDYMAKPIQIPVLLEKVGRLIHAR